jgi:Sec-independent protein translocase protein TatA
MELAIVLVVALLVLGPSRLIDLARGLGRLVRDVRSAFSDLSRAIEGGEGPLDEGGRDRPPGGKRD